MDATSLQIVPPDVAEDTYAKMSPRYNNVYKKNNEPIFPFNHETLNGLAVMTEFTPTDGDSSELNDPRYYYTNYVDVLKDYEVEHKIKIGTPITFNGKIGSENYKNKITCYGKLKLSKILDRDIDKLSILKDDRSRMDAKAAAKLSAYLNKEEDGVEKRLEIQKAALKAVTEAGVVTFSYKTLYVDTNTETYKEICKIADSDDLTDQQKLALLTDKYAKYEKEIQAKFSDDLKNELSRAGRVKLSSISALNMPSLIINGVEETPIITRGNLLGGFSEKDMIYHSIENRSLQSIKQSGVPSSGYITRQISFVLNNYVYHDGEDKDDPGLLIPRYKALGRTAPNGILYPDKELARGSEEDLVPVRSVVTKNKGDLNTITPDMIGTKFNMTDGTAIGLSFSTSFTEAITQGALGLKHGGHEKQLDKTGYLVCEHSSCTFREEGKWFYIKSRGKEYKYPRPDNLVTFGKDTFVKGENICCAYNTISPINGLNSLIQLMNARGSAGYRYYEKENITVSDCYAYSDGEIRYVETPEGEIEVHIGSVVYQYNPLCMYYFADGEKVKKYDRICNGVINMPHVISYFGNDINSIYLIFRKQFYSLNDKGFLKDNGKNGLTDLHAMQEEIVELVFRGLTSVTYDPVTAKIEEIEYQGSNRAILGKNSFFTTLSYGHARKTVGKALKGEVDLSDDVMTETVLGMLLNNTLDD